MERSVESTTQQLRFIMEQLDQSEATSVPTNRQKPFRFWCFTDNAPEDTQPQWKELPTNVRYMVWQLEELDHQHLQGYLELFASRKLGWLKKRISTTAHFEPRKGTQQQAIDYCTLETYKGKAKGRIGGPWPLGTPTGGQGTRGDILEFRDSIKSGKRKRHFIEEAPRMIWKYRRFYEMCAFNYKPSRKEDLEVVLALGQPGTGKTRFAYDNWGANLETSTEFYALPITNKTLWFDGYDMHKYVLIDDFAGKYSATSLVVLLRILDRYIIQVPIKGGHVWWGPDRIYITSNILPHNWYTWEGRELQQKALKRRIHRVFDFDQLDEEGMPADITEEPYLWTIV